MTRNHAGSAASRRNRGFTLVEAMVALIVLSVGLLGIAALYVETLRANRTSLYRTQAVNMATDIGDRMRSNRDPALAPAGFYDCEGSCAVGEGGNPIAIADLTDWVTQIETQLPGGAATITYTASTATTPAAYVVGVSWDELGQDDPVTYQLRIEI